MVVGVDDGGGGGCHGGGEGVGFCYGSSMGVYVEVGVAILVVGGGSHCLLLCYGSGS